MLCLLEAFHADVHDKVCKLNESKWVPEELGFFQKAVLEDAVAEVVAHFDLFLIDESVSDSDNCLLHFFGEFDSSFEQRDVVLAQVEGVVCHPEVIVQSVVHPRECVCFLLVCLTWHPVGIIIFAILVIWTTAAGGFKQC